MKAIYYYALGETKRARNKIKIILSQNIKTGQFYTLTPKHDFMLVWTPTAIEYFDLVPLDGTTWHDTLDDLERALENHGLLDVLP